MFKVFISNIYVIIYPQITSCFQAPNTQFLLILVVFTYLSKCLILSLGQEEQLSNTETNKFIRKPAARRQCSPKDKSVVHAGNQTNVADTVEHRNLRLNTYVNTATELCDYIAKDLNQEYQIRQHLCVNIIVAPNKIFFRKMTVRLLTHFLPPTFPPIFLNTYQIRLRLKCDGTRAETSFRLSAKRTSPFKSAGASVQSNTGSRGVRISISNAGYTMFRGSVKGTGYPLHSPVSPSLPLPPRHRVPSRFN